jgi:hypothetical protein
MSEETPEYVVMTKFGPLKVGDYVIKEDFDKEKLIELIKYDFVNTTNKVFEFKYGISKVDFSEFILGNSPFNTDDADTEVDLQTLKELKKTVDNDSWSSAKAKGFTVTGIGDDNVLHTYLQEHGEVDLGIHNFDLSRNSGAEYVVPNSYISAIDEHIDPSTLPFPTVREADSLWAAIDQLQYAIDQLKKEVSRCVRVGRE